MYLGHEIPGGSPAEAMVIHEHPHELWHCDGGVGIVQLEGNLLRELVEGVMRLPVPPHHILHANKGKYPISCQILEQGALALCSDFEHAEYPIRVSVTGFFT